MCIILEKYHMQIIGFEPESRQLGKIYREILKPNDLNNF